MPLTRKNHTQHIPEHREASAVELLCTLPCFEEWWAKTDESGRPVLGVRDHCVIVGKVAAKLLEELPGELKTRLGQWNAPLLAATHDVGKISAGFSVKSPDFLRSRGLHEVSTKQVWAEQRGRSHGLATQWILRQYLGHCEVAERLAAAIGGHHGSLHSKPALPPEVSTGGLLQAFDQRRRECLDSLQNVFGLLPAERVYAERAQRDDSWIWLLAGLISVADWIGSTEEIFPYNGNYSADSEIDSRASDAIARFGLKIAPVRSCKFEDVFGFSANALQQAVDRLYDQASPSLCIIEAPTGEGKTEAAIWAAVRLLHQQQVRGLYFGLPTQVTSNRIFERLEPYLARLSAGSSHFRLQHGGAWLLENSFRTLSLSSAEDADLARAARDWLAKSKRGLLAQYGAGTIDQALLGVLCVKHFFVRRYALAGKVIILDEVHSYDIYTSGLIEQLIRALTPLGARFIILSATLTARQRQKLLAAVSDSSDQTAAEESYPLISAVASGAGATVTFHEVENPTPPLYPNVQVSHLVDQSTPEIAQQVIKAARAGRNVLWIRNTVDLAQEAYRSVCGQMHEREFPVGLLHSRFPWYRRQVIEEHWIGRLSKDATNRPRGSVLVSTQVAEQSLDIDADLLVTDLAPTDMLIQRLGRLWRHRRESRSSGDARPLWLVHPSLDEDLTADALRQLFLPHSAVYAPYVLLRTLKVWGGLNELRIPDQVRELLEASYEEPERTESQALLDLRQALEEQQAEMERAVLTRTQIWQKAQQTDHEEQARTRWESYPTATLVLFKGDAQPHASTNSLLTLEECEIALPAAGFDMRCARAMHRCAVKIPKWLLCHLGPQPEAFTPVDACFFGSAAGAFVQPDGCLSLHVTGESPLPGLQYSAEIGLQIFKAELQQNFDSDDIYELGF